MKNLLIVAHSPSPNTQKLSKAVEAGAKAPALDTITVTHLSPFESYPANVISADAIILGTTENLGYMSGALKDFFDRCYYPLLEIKQGMPCASFIRAGHDGTGTLKALETVITGLKWRWVQEPLVCKGDFQEQFVTDCFELGNAMAVALDEGII